MAHTKDAVVIDALTGLVMMLVVPDDDAQLDYPSYNPIGSLQIRVPHQPGVLGSAIAVESLVSAAQAINSAVRTS